jgi:hypothetical protein
MKSAYKTILDTQELTITLRYDGKYFSHAKERGWYLSDNKGNKPCKK